MNEPWLCMRCNKVNAPWLAQCNCYIPLYKKYDLSSPNELYMKSMSKEEFKKMYLREIKDE